MGLPLEPTRTRSPSRRADVTEGVLDDVTTSARTGRSQVRPVADRLPRIREVLRMDWVRCSVIQRNRARPRPKPHLPERPTTASPETGLAGTPPRRLALAAVMCLVVGGVLGLVTATLVRPSGVYARFTPPREPARAIALRDQDGHLTTLTQARGKVVVLTFLYSTCRDLCPAQAADIIQAIGRLGPRAGDVLVYGVSVDPVGDTPRRARAFLKKYGVYGGPVHFLVGTRAQLAPVWRAYGIVPINATPQEAGAAAMAYDRLTGTHSTGAVSASPPLRARGGRRGLPRHRRLALPRPCAPPRRPGLRALGLRDVDRQARRATCRDPVRAAHAPLAGRRPPAPRGRALSAPWARAGGGSRKRSTAVERYGMTDFRPSRLGGSRFGWSPRRRRRGHRQRSERKGEKGQITAPGMGDRRARIPNTRLLGRVGCLGPDFGRSKLGCGLPRCGRRNPSARSAGRNDDPAERDDVQSIGIRRRYRSWSRRRVR